MDYIKQLDYISEKLLFIKLKVEQDTKNGLFDINKYGEDIFMHLLNSAYGFKINNANEVFHDNFPAIDLIDEENKFFIQVTSTLTTNKIYSTIKKKDENEELKEYKHYKLKMCYLAGKPDFGNLASLNLEKKGIEKEDLLDLDSIISIARKNQQKCKDIYNTLNQRLDSKAYNLDIENYFNKFEAQLNKEITKKFYSYNKDFESFLQSNNNVLEVFGTGGHGKSHLLKYLASLKNEYTPIIFTKQDNVEADLKKLDFAKQYLLIYDDIDKFLENSVSSIFSFLIDSGSKIMISYRTASKHLVEEKISKFNALKTQELPIIWSNGEIKDLILLLRPDATDFAINSINNQFNSNPFLITQALKGDIDGIKNFSKNILSDSVKALKRLEIKIFEIEKLLFRIALLSPCPRNLIDINDNDKVNQLITVGILRELNNKIRFNPDVLGDLYLTSFVKNYENKYKEIALEYMADNLELIITNLSYVLGYEDNDGLELFFKDIVKGWLKNEDFRSSNLRILYRIVRYAPFESFMYLKEVTTILEIKENEYPKNGGIMDIVSKISEVDFNISDEHINLGSLVPIINKLISNLKNERDSGRLQIKHLIDFLVSTKVQSFPKPYFANHNISSVFNDMIIPYESKNNDVIIEALEEMKKWVNNDSMNLNKLDILKSALSNLFMGSKSMYFDTKRIEFDTSKENIRKVIDKAKEIVLIMLKSSNIDLKCRALDILRDVGNSINEELQAKNEQYYYEITIELFENMKEQLTKVNDYKFLSKLEEVLFNAMAFRKHKDEAFSLFLDIPRTPIFIFNQCLVSTMFTVYNLDKFIDEYHKQEDVHKWLFDKYQNRHDTNISEDDIGLYNYFIKSHTTEDDFINFVNTLHFIENSTNSYKFSTELTKLLNYWYEQKPQLFKNLAIKGIANISNNAVSKTIDNFLFDLGLTTLDIDCIDETLETSELIRYVGNSFKSKNIELYQKLLTIFKEKEKESISWFIDNSFMNIYSILKDNTDFNTYKPYIHELLDLIIKHRITPSIYLIFILENLEKNNISFELVKDKLRKIVYIPSYKEDLEEIKISKEDLKKLFHFLDYKIEDIFARVFLKIFAKVIFFNYKKEHNIQECYLIQDYVKDYEDYKEFISLVLDYYNNFTYTQANEEEVPIDYKIDINYFFSGLKNENFERYINELIENNNKEEILVLINAIPIKAKYKELLINTLNFLSTNNLDEKIITLLTKERVSTSVYVGLLNDKTSNIDKGFTYDFVMKELNNQEELFVYISKSTVLDVDVLSKIEDIVAEIQVTKNIVLEINLEQTIT
ncbi:SMEK domain-containing protein [Arcobacter sp.]|uniref:SMEK domain-containing protein n=1 Tax=unclassified Arcobacter TaxID=2593671 RepID=UPI003B00C548